MSSYFLLDSSKDFSPDPEENIMHSIFKQYERVIVESLVTSFGLDFLIKDRHGGDVDTIHSVRQVGKDENMTYKNDINEYRYDDRGIYTDKNSTKENKVTYHSDTRYVEKNREIRKQRDAGVLYDIYTGKRMNPKDNHLDHTISAKEIHDDAGRVLSGLRGVDLANSSENLNVTNQRTNLTKSALPMDDFLNKYGDEYTDSQKATMREKDTIARKSYEAKLATAYYTSPQFAKDVTFAAGNVGARMGIRQALGFVFAEIWFSVKDEFNTLGNQCNFGELLSAIGNGIKRGFENAKEKYKDLFAKFSEGAVAGTLTSLTTTLCNIFFTTARNVVKIIRQSYMSAVQAAKILFINPDNLPFGDRMRAVAKVIATGASIVVGGLVMEAINKTPIGAIPVAGDIIQIFCGTFVTGIMSCTLLYFLDRNETVNRLVQVCNTLHTIEGDLDYFRKQGKYFEKYAAELMQIDIEKFEQEAEMYSSIVLEIESVSNESERKDVLENILKKMGIKLPWEGDFDTFMKDKNNRLVFE